MQTPRFFYGWVIVAVAFVTLFLVVGTRFSLGVFYVAILEEYHWSRAETATAFSLMLVVHAVFSLAVGALFDWLGPRKFFPLGAVVIALGFAACSQIRAIWQLYLFLGVVSALGISTLAFVPHMALVSTWFERRRGAATGLAYAGIGAGQLALAPILQGLTNAFGWRGAFLWVAGVVLAVVVPLTAIFHRRCPQDLGLLPDGEERAILRYEPNSKPVIARSGKLDVDDPWPVRRAVRTSAFWCLMATVLGMGVVVNTLVVHQMAHLTDVGFSKMVAATLLGLVGGVRSLGGMTLGSLSDRVGRETAYTMGTVGSVIGVFLFMSIQDASQVWQLYTFVLLYGLGYGALGPIYASATADLFAGRSLGTILGCLEAAYGLGGAIGVFVAGYVYDIVGAYGASFSVVIIAAIFSCAALWLAAPRKPLRDKCG